MCGSRIGYQFHIPSTQEVILNETFILGKNPGFYQKSQNSGIFKKSVLYFKATAIRLCKYLCSVIHHREGKDDKNGQGIF